MSKQDSKVSNIKGKIKYFNINNWTEHSVKDIDDFQFARKVFRFIEEAVNQCSTCLVISFKNKCATVVICLIYLLLKYKWDLKVALQFINSRKIDIEITKLIIKNLSQIQNKVAEEMNN